MKIKVACKVAAVITVGGLCIGISAASSPGDLFRDLQQPYSVARERIRRINNEVGELLLKMPSVSAARISARSVRESYLLMVNLYCGG